MMSNADPTKQIVIKTQSGELTTVQRTKDLNVWKRENGYHDSANYPEISHTWINN